MLNGGRVYLLSIYIGCHLSGTPIALHIPDLPSPAVGEGGVDNDCSAAGGSVASLLQQAATLPLQDTDSELQW